jgi:hypothetical protein
VESEITLENLGGQLLMCDMRRNLDATPMPKRRSTIEFLFTGVRQSQRQWWLIVTPGEAVELCSIDPGFDLDLYIACDLRTMTAIWMGLDSVRVAGIVRASLSWLFRGAHDIDQCHARPDYASAPGRGATARDARAKVETYRTDGV